MLFLVFWLPYPTLSKTCAWAPPLPGAAAQALPALHWQEPVQTSALLSSLFSQVPARAIDVRTPPFRVVAGRHFWAEVVGALSYTGLRGLAWRGSGCCSWESSDLCYDRYVGVECRCLLQINQSCTYCAARCDWLLPRCCGRRLGLLSGSWGLFEEIAGPHCTCISWFRVWLKDERVLLVRWCCAMLLLFVICYYRTWWKKTRAS